METGIHTGKIMGTFFRTYPNGNVMVNVRLEVNGEDIYSSIFADGPNATEETKRIARARVKQCGFDLDQFEPEELIANPHLLDGVEVEILVKQETYKDKNGVSQTKMKADIRTPREEPEPDKAMVKKAFQGLREMKSKQEKNDDKSPDADDPKF